MIGALWAWLAPSIHGVVALTKSGERVRAHLGNEADHFFVAAFLMVGMLCVMAVVAAVLAGNPGFVVGDVARYAPAGSQRWVERGVLRLTPESGADGFTAHVLMRKKD